jgi:hypothetical protein
MKEAIESAFPQVITGLCLQTETRSAFYIYDSEVEPRRCYISEKETEKIHFTVYNPASAEVVFLAIDKCIFDDQGPARCDFALFTDSKFCFVEIKDVKTRGRRRARLQAKDQLISTIDQFIQRGVSFNNQELMAIVCFVKKELYPSISAQYIDTLVEFEDRFGAQFLITNNLSF